MINMTLEKTFFTIGKLYTIFGTYHSDTSSLHVSSVHIMYGIIGIAEKIKKNEISKKELMERFG